MDMALLALVIFIAVYIVMVLDLADKAVAVIIGALTMVGLGILTEEEALGSMHWEALGLIFGMFILVAALNESGFFRWIGLHALKATKFDLLKIFIIFCGLSAFLAAFCDSITVMIFMGTLTIDVCRILKVPPLPLIIAEICSANIGGSATLVGDPPNVIIGTALNLTFVDFATHTGPIAMFAFATNLVMFGLWYRHLFERKHVDVKKIMEEHKDLEPFSAVKDLRLMRIALVVFVFTVTLLVLHHVLDLLVAYVAILGAGLVLLFGGRKVGDLIDKIDWHTIVFLGGLFVMVGGLERSGVLSSFAHGIADMTGDNMMATMIVIIWIGGILSAVFDNVPFAAAMVPVIREISDMTGLALNPMAFSLALGCDIGGNMTPIGASANVVGLAVAQKHGIPYTWATYCKVAIPITLVVLAVVTVGALLWLA